ncbi:unnamed protein product [Eruca vesicaria subsp. sativa]|uniref:Uncharacterized protein n=1 Tax=Eruca vesicaria subsp. sativa TaxID=29727 RepID=A0ABC8K179_ERUVS|nr:unnamed protein product [Eruca vesicaria subsp. sativa]
MAVAQPYLLVIEREVTVKSSNERVATLNLLEPCKLETVKIPGKTLLTELASPNQRDCVVAANLFAPLNSLCRPGDSHIETPNAFFTSVAMHSMKDQRFYLHSLDTAPTDLIKTCSADFPPVSPYRRFIFSNIPEITQDLYQYLVE